MTHDEWRERVDGILEMDDAAAAIEAALALAAECERIARASISDWHTRQSIGLAISLCQDANRSAEACDLLEKIAREHRLSLQEAGHGAAQPLAEAALLRFKLGQPERGVQLAREALEMFGRFPEPNLFLVDALLEWRKHIQSKV